MPRVERFLAVTVIVAALVGLSTSVHAARRKLALLIGIQSYSRTGQDWQDLDGPLNDVHLVRQVLTTRFGFSDQDIEEIDDTEATRAHIEKAFQRLAARSRDAIVYIHYSGHGSRVLDVNGDEGPRKKDSTLVPINGRNDESWEILDDEINLWLSRILKETRDVILVVDACHSGTITRSATSLKTRGAPTEDARPYTWARNLPALTSADLMRSGSRFIRVSACQDHQLAQEYEGPDGTVYGLLTWQWCAALMNAPAGATYGDVFQVASSRMLQTRLDQQRPQIEGASRTALFSGEVPERPVLLPVTFVEGGQVRFSGGLLNGVTRGSVFMNSGSIADHHVQVRIDSVSAFSSSGTVLDGRIPTAGDLFREVRHVYPFPPVRIRIADEGHHAEWSGELASKIARISGALLVTGTRLKADIIVAIDSSDPPVVRLLDGSENPFGLGAIRKALLERVLAGDADLERVVWRVSRLIANQTILKYAREFETSKNDLEVTVVYWNPGEPPTNALAKNASGDLFDIAAGSTIGFLVRSRLPSDVYLTVMNIAPDGKCLDLIPGGRAADEFRLVPEVSRIFPAATIVKGDAGLIDTYVCFLSSAPPGLGSLGGASLDAIDLATRGADTGTDFDRIRDALGSCGAITRGAGGPELVARTFPVFVRPAQR